MKEIDFIDRLLHKRDLCNKYSSLILKRFNTLSDFEVFVEKVLTKYRSEEYREREKRAGYFERRDPLIFKYLIDFADKMGVVLENPEEHIPGVMKRDFFLVYGNYAYGYVSGQGAEPYIVKIS